MTYPEIRSVPDPEYLRGYQAAVEKLSRTLELQAAALALDEPAPALVAAAKKAKAVLTPEAPEGPETGYEVVDRDGEVIARGSTAVDAWAKSATRTGKPENRLIWAGATIRKYVDDSKPPATIPPEFWMIVDDERHPVACGGTQDDAWDNAEELLEKSPDILFRTGYRATYVRGVTEDPRPSFLFLPGNDPSFDRFYERGYLDSRYDNAEPQNSPFPPMSPHGQSWALGQADGKADRRNA